MVDLGRDTVPSARAGGETGLGVTAEHREHPEPAGWQCRGKAAPALQPPG